MIHRLRDFWLLAEGSTRPLGLMRVAVAAIVWSRFASELLPYRDLSPDRLALGAAFYLSTAAMFVGWQTRLSTFASAVVLCVMVYGYGRRWGVEPWVHHHTTLLAISTVLLALTPCGRSFSLDRWLAVRRAERGGGPAPAERGELWATRLIALQVSTLYFWSAYDKSSGPFLSGDRLEQIFVELYWVSDGILPAWAQAGFTCAALVTVALEYALAFGLWVPRLRPWLLVAGVALHGLFFVFLPVSTFSVTMVALYLAFLDPDRFHAGVDRWLGRGGPSAEPAGAGLR
jgi:Vitamin K-dependent gamma-carboxylase